jgi:adenine-specific DNA methylase
LANVQGEPGPKDLDVRKAILKFIGDFSNWDLAANPRYLEVGRGLVKAAHGEEAPVVVDPFAGGGSIPLEALRVGCEALASDLNPVACLILKVMLEDIPRHGLKLAEELRHVGAEITKQAEKELGQYYPRDPDGATPIAYLWARTVRCESPNCGAEIPLTRSFWLRRRAGRYWALQYKVEKPKGRIPRIHFDVFVPKDEKQVPPGTITLGNAKCIACETVLARERVRAQLREQRGGGDVLFDEHGRRKGGALLLAVVLARSEKPGRFYRLPSEDDYDAVRRAVAQVSRLVKRDNAGLPPIPDEPIPHDRVWKNNPIRVHHYGISRWGDLFTARQKLALATLSKLSSGTNDDLTRELLALLVSKEAERLSSLVSWISSTQAPRGTFARQALPMIWDFLELVPIAGEEEYPELVSTVAGVVELWSTCHPFSGQVQAGDACELGLPDDSCSAWFTDPPYYDAVPYALLSDFFFVWLKRALPGVSKLRDPFDASNPLTPKAREIVLDEVAEFEGRPKDSAFFESRMAISFAEGRRVTRGDGIGSVVFAHKTTEGWEALLNGIVRGGWVITASWPVATERPGRLRSPRLPQAFTSSVARAPNTPISVTGRMCSASFRIASAPGWSGCHPKA